MTDVQVMKVLFPQVQMLQSGQRLHFRTRFSNIRLSGRDLVAKLTGMFLEICADMSVLATELYT